MTAQAATAPAAPAEELLRRLSLRPAEGWLTLLPAALMVVVFAGSFVDAGWTPGSAGDAGFLPWVGLLGLTVGVLGAKAGWGRWRTHVVGALFAGLVLPLIVGGIVLHDQVGWDPHGLAQRMVASLGIAQHVWTDLVVLNRPFTSQYAHYHLIFGALVWGAGQLAGFTVFGHRRPLDAVVVLGLVILANMALTSHPQLTLLVLFSAAALLLLIRTHVFEEQVTWTRRKIGDPAAVGQLYLRGGAAFITAAVLGSLLLTAAASSAPLQGMWADLPSKLQAVSQWLLRFAPTGGDFRPTGAISFSSEARTTGIWAPSNATAFRAQLLASESREFKWRAGTYADYTTFGWTWGPPGQTRDVPTAARDLLQGATWDTPTAVGRRELRYRITLDGYRDATILGPNRVQWVDRPSTAVLRGVDGWFTTVKTDDSPGTYNASAMIPVLQDVQGGITEARLRAAGTEYPAELEAVYTDLPPDAMGLQATALRDTILGAVRTPPGADPANVYDLVRTMEAYLRSADHFSYREDVRALRDAQCGGVSTVECFAIIKAGYCEYYASTMAVLLRASGVPARIAYGFLHGPRDGSGLEIVPASAAHWWVEVFFPDTGWVEFDPTGGGIGQFQPIPSGSVGVPTSRPSQVPATFREPTTPPSGSFTPTGGTGSGIGPFIAIAIILAIGVGALAFASYRRTPNKPMHPDQAWGSVARLAARVGLGPRPSQTVYEYAGALGDAVPAARIELTTIARAKVEVAYGRRDLGTDRLKRIAQAYHRLRFAIIGVVLRRGLRRRNR